MIKKRQPVVDGLGPREIQMIRSAIRLVWHRCHAKKLAVKRCTGEDGFLRCEKCKEVVPKIAVDHIITVGEVDAGFLARLFCPSSGLQGLCPNCHRLKTKEERGKK